MYLCILYIQVFFKEHARGLTSNIQYWATGSPALYVMRDINTVMFCGIAYNMLVLRNNGGNYCIIMIIIIINTIIITYVLLLLLLMCYYY